MECHAKLPETQLLAEIVKIRKFYTIFCKHINHREIQEIQKFGDLFAYEITV